MCRLQLDLVITLFAEWDSEFYTASLWLYHILINKSLSNYVLNYKGTKKFHTIIDKVCRLYPISQLLS